MTEVTVLWGAGGRGCGAWDKPVTTFEKWIQATV